MPVTTTPCNYGCCSFPMNHGPFHMIVIQAPGSWYVFMKVALSLGQMFIICDLPRKLPTNSTRKLDLLHYCSKKKSHKIGHDLLTIALFNNRSSSYNCGYRLRITYMAFAMVTVLF